jgi:hypothetical protein
MLNFFSIRSFSYRNSVLPEWKSHYISSPYPTAEQHRQIAQKMQEEGFNRLDVYGASGGKENPILHLDFLQHYKGLKGLSFRGCALTDIGPIEVLADSLVGFGLSMPASSKQIIDLYPLKHLNNLNNLFLGGKFKNTAHAYKKRYPFKKLMHHFLFSAQ